MCASEPNLFIEAFLGFFFVFVFLLEEEERKTSNEFKSAVGVKMAGRRRGGPSA